MKKSILKTLAVIYLIYKTSFCQIIKKNIPINFDFYGVNSLDKLKNTYFFQEYFEYKKIIDFNNKVNNNLIQKEYKKKVSKI